MEKPPIPLLRNGRFEFVIEIHKSKKATYFYTGSLYAQSPDPIPSNKDTTK